MVASPLPGLDASPLPGLELLERTDGYAIAVWRRLLLLAWRGRASATGIERCRALYSRWAEHAPGDVAYLVVVPRQVTRPPDEAARTAMRLVSATPWPHLRGMATLIEAEGFIAASVRALMTRVSGESAPVVFRTTADAAAWAGALLSDPALTPDALAEAIRTAREG